MTTEMMKRDAPASPSPVSHLPAASADRVLLVEDESRLRDMLVRALREMGFNPAAVTSAEAAVRFLQHGTLPPGILILDLNLPGMDGMELLATVRQRWPAVQVIILTGFGDLAAAKKAMHLDVVDFLTKPCALGDLEIALDRARSRLRPRDVQDRADRAARLDRAARAERAEAAAAEAAESAPPPQPLEFTPRETSAAMSLEEVERQHILAALERHRGNRNATAAELGISLRKLYYRLAQYQKQGHIKDQE
jgi:DNA-binding NtrC family response regulator